MGAVWDDRDDPVDTTTIDCVVCGCRLAVDPRNLSYKPADTHPIHDPFTGLWRGRGAA